MTNAEPNRRRRRTFRSRTGLGSEQLEPRALMAATDMATMAMSPALPASHGALSAPPMASTPTTGAAAASPSAAWGYGLTDPGMPSAWNATGMPQGEFQTRLAFVKRATIDPLLAPGNTNFMHMHDFFVNPSIDENSTFTSLMKAGPSAAAPASNRSAYWVPSLYDETTGRYLTPQNDSIAYYSVQRPLEPSKIVAMPAGLSVIAGSAMPSARQSTMVTFWNYIGTSEQYDHIPQGAEWRDLPLQAVVMFPQFWDGKSLTGSNFKDHMAYDRGGDGGPASHPYLLPELSLQIRYGRIPRDARLVLSSDLMTKDRPGYAPGWSMHADFIHTPWPEQDAAGRSYDGFERRVADSLRWPTISGPDGNAVRANPRGLPQPFTPSPITVPGVLPASSPAGPAVPGSGGTQAPPPLVAPTLTAVESRGGVTLLKDAAGFAYVQPAGGQPVVVSRADSYWNGRVPLTRGDATLVAAERDPQGRLRVLDTSGSGRFGWILDASGRFMGEERYEAPTLPAAETLFGLDLDADGVIGSTPPANPGPTTLTARDRAFWRPMRGVGFSVSSLGALPDQARLEGALRQVVSLGFTMIRTWGTDAYTGRILETITRLNLPLRVQAGIYITNDAEARSQIDSALAILAPYARSVVGVSLGNEQIVDWNASNALTVPQVIGHVQYFKSRSTLPVTYNFAGETFLPNASQWSQNLAGLVAALDYVNVHTYGGFFDNRTNPGWTPALQLAAVQTYETMLSEKLASLGLASKPVLIGETGWQSTGGNGAVTNPQRMREYYDAVSRYVYGPASRFDSMFYFNLTDEAWKRGDDHWGLFAEGSATAIGAAKFAIPPQPSALVPTAPGGSRVVVEARGSASLLRDGATGIAYVQPAGGAAVAVSRSDSYWNGLVPLTRAGATLVAAERDAQGRLRVLDTSPYGAFGWILDASGRFTGEERYEAATLPAAESLFGVDIDNDGTIGATRSTVSPPPSGAAPTTPTASTGSFPLTLVNTTGGAYRDDQIFVTIIGQVTPGNWSWIDAAGAVHPLDHRDANAADRLSRNGVNYANMSFTLAQAGNLRLPPALQGGRIFISMGQPLFIGISPDDKGYAGPNPAAPSDPNYGTVFDWYEMTYVYGQVPFGGNTTQVDQFGLPLKVTLEQSSSGYSTTRGLTATRAQAFAAFARQAPAEFQPLVVRDAAGTPLRILAPRTAAPGPLATWFDGAVNDFWSRYRTQRFTFTGAGFTVKGGIDANGMFSYTITSAGRSDRYLMRRPTSQEIFACSGPFAGTGTQGAFLAEFSAAFNRGVASSPERWSDTTAYYPAGGRWNAFAKAFHDLGVGTFAYGFPYDDVNDQSSVQILGNARPPSRLTIAVGG